jgi:hypothetical protein
MTEATPAAIVRQMRAVLLGAIRQKIAALRSEAGTGSK